ncbi:MAG: hypothetical protein KDB53_00905 [Planctomycetes bacterium]|nr:hypothetical protein [Planctomycetota bacterium]
MQRLERYLLPIILGIGLLGLLLTKAEEGTVVAIGRTVGIFLTLFLAVGFIIRSVVKLRRARRDEALIQEWQALQAEVAAEEAAARTASES